MSKLTSQVDLVNDVPCSSERVDSEENRKQTEEKVHERFGPIGNIFGIVELEQRNLPQENEETTKKTHQLKVRICRELDSMNGYEYQKILF